MTGARATGRRAGVVSIPPDRAPRLTWLRPLAAGALAAALIVTAVAVTQVERRSGADTPAASPTRLASVQSNRYAYWKVALGSRTFGLNAN